ncbi:integrase family protein [Ancylobacter novellus DSM 506]|uniref:Integrase family protein n=1 Tax=Ancylobacter novellus (strain ATCC 8093 / DSM 506 / JCM 20403 / CCM 1077 / IAM 12100 / NBRC 12443 / NCIMB 10456) TaxID=639283 RepID=D7A2T1_ANCN5|nr:site-specific integrase [Ancylobacter novellus]ADH91611.1 integrase family protein [Ancylobacter novellus DSM 506]
MALKLVRRAGTPNWYVRGTLLGTTIIRSTKETELQHAKKRLREIEADIRSLRDRTFKEIADAYLADGASARFIEPIVSKLGRVRARTLRQDVVDEAAKKIYPKVTSETLNRQFYTPFIAIWNFAARKEWVHSRTWARPRKPRQGTLVRRVVSRAGTVPTSYDRAVEFVAAMSPGPAMLMTALFYTGMRPIEMLGLDAASVNVEERWITLLSTKTGEPRGVPMHEFLVPLFQALAGRAGAVFRSPKGQPYTPKDEGGGQLKSSVGGARRRSGINGISPYTGRHTVSTQLVVNGVHPHIKDQILGHAVDDMSRHYTHVPQQPLIDAINTLPVPQAWRDLPWWEDPLKWQRRMVEGTGRRTDLGY